MNLLRLIAMLALALVAACAKPEVEPPPPPLGDFRLGFNAVVGRTAKMVPPSREATAEEWEAVLGAAIEQRLGGYEGDRLYHLGISVDAYALAVPGIPVVLNPKSVLAFSVTVWDDAEQRKLNEEPRRFQVLEAPSAQTFIVGSGLTQTKEEQMQNLAASAVKRLEAWLVENRAWFERYPPGEGALPENADSVAVPAN